MSLTVEEIKQKSFKKELRGYRKQEVSDFLQQVQNDYAAAQDEIKALKLALNEYEEKSSQAAELLIEAQKNALAMTTEAQAKAEEKIEKAQAKADEINRKAVEEKTAELLDVEQRVGILQRDYHLLKDNVYNFREQSKNLLQDQLNQLDNDNWQAYIEQYYSNVNNTQPLIVPADGEQVQVTPETAEFTSIDSTTPTGVELDDTEQPNSELPEGVVADSETVILFPEDYKNHD